MSVRLYPVLFRPSITLNGQPRAVIDLCDGTFGLFEGAPGAMTQLGYRASWRMAVRRARDIIAGRAPDNTSDALLTFAMVMVAADADMGGIGEDVALTMPENAA